MKIKKRILNKDKLNFFDEHNYFNLEPIYNQLKLPRNCHKLVSTHPRFDSFKQHTYILHSLQKAENLVRTTNSQLNLINFFIIET